MNEPATGIIRGTIDGPLSCRRQQRVLDRILGGAEITKPPDDRAQHLWRELAQQKFQMLVQRSHWNSSDDLLRI